MDLLWILAWGFGVLGLMDFGRGFAKDFSFMSIYLLQRQEYGGSLPKYSNKFTKNSKIL